MIKRFIKSALNVIRIFISLVLLVLVIGLVGAAFGSEKTTVTVTVTSSLIAIILLFTSFFILPFTFKARLYRLGYLIMPKFLKNRLQAKVSSKMDKEIREKQFRLTSIEQESIKKSRAYQQQISTLEQALKADKKTQQDLRDSSQTEIEESKNELQNLSTKRIELKKQIQQLEDKKISIHQHDHSISQNSQELEKQNEKILQENKENLSLLKSSHNEYVRIKDVNKKIEQQNTNLYAQQQSILQNIDILQTKKEQLKSENSIFFESNRKLSKTIDSQKETFFRISSKYDSKHKEYTDFIKLLEDGKKFIKFDNHSLTLSEALEKKELITISLNNKNKILSKEKEFEQSSEFQGFLNHQTKKEMAKIDNLSGHEFEDYCGNLLKIIGYTNVVVTKGSGDHGVDITANKGTMKFAFQCKNYSHDVGNKAVQEVYSGMKYYKADKGIILTSYYFTKGAKEQADADRIGLWNRDTLQGLILDTFESSPSRRIKNTSTPVLKVLN